MDSRDEVEGRVNTLMLAICWGSTTGIVLLCARLVLVLSQAPKFHAIFADLLGGHALPPLTRLFVLGSRGIMVVAVLLSAGAVVALFVATRRVWPVCVAVALCILMAVTTEIFRFAMMIPLVSIITEMST